MNDSIIDDYLQEGGREKFVTVIKRTIPGCSGKEECEMEKEEKYDEREYEGENDAKEGTHSEGVESRRRHRETSSARSSATAVAQANEKVTDDDDDENEERRKRRRSPS
jgi:hypothetical protein